jgi:pilus assembly protein CpaF
MFKRIPLGKPKITQLEDPELQNVETDPEPPVEMEVDYDLDLPSEEEQTWGQHIHQRLLEVIDLAVVSSMEEEQSRKKIREVIQRLLNEESVPLGMQSRQQVLGYVENEIFGLGPIEPLMKDRTVADILINGAHNVYVERHGKLMPTRVKFRDEAHLMRILDRIVSGVGRRIDESTPMVDARLADGSRVNAIIPPLSVDGAIVSIRRFTIERLGVEEMIDLGTLNQACSDVLRGVVRGRLNTLISGGTGAGKTTMLNFLSGFISEDERIVTIEDSAELQLQQPHIVRLETRPPNIEGKGEVSQRDLVRNSLRMRPDRIIIGEVRGGEALDMLQAMNTGHDGSLATIHANTPRDALSRLESMVSMSGVQLPLLTVRTQIASALDVVIQVERMEDGHRRVVSVQEVQGMEGEVVIMSEIFHFQRAGRGERGKVSGRFSATGVVPHFNERLQQRGLGLDFALFELDKEL